MDGIATSSPAKSTARQPLGGIDANQRSLSMSSASQMISGKDGRASLSPGKGRLMSVNASFLVEKAALGKRTVDQLEIGEGGDERGEGGVNKKRKISLDGLGGTVETLGEDVPTIEVESVQETEKENQGGIVDGDKEQLAHEVTAVSVLQSKKSICCFINTTFRQSQNTRANSPQDINAPNLIATLLFPK